MYVAGAEPGAVGAIPVVVVQDVFHMVVQVVGTVDTEAVIVALAVSTGTLVVDVSVVGTVVVETPPTTAPSVGALYESLAVGASAPRPLPQMV